MPPGWPADRLAGWLAGSWVVSWLAGGRHGKLLGRLAMWLARLGAPLGALSHHVYMLSRVPQNRDWGNIIVVLDALVSRFVIRAL